MLAVGIIVKHKYVSGLDETAIIACKGVVCADFEVNTFSIPIPVLKFYYSL